MTAAPRLAVSASAASVAGLLQQAQNGLVPAESVIVCTLTGNGLKDPQLALQGWEQPQVIDADAAVAAERLGLLQ